VKSTFPGYYRPTDEEFSQLWKDCVFVPDANVLLNLYRYTPTTREELFGVLEQLQDRLWISHQAASEYHRNRVTVIADRLRTEQEVHSALTKAEQQISEVLKQASRHPFMDREAIFGRIRCLFSTVSEELRTGASEYRELLHDDPTLERIAALFDGRVGPPYPDKSNGGNSSSSRTVESICREGKTRYDQKVPPGYADGKDKPEPRCYGDLIIWLQTIDYARETKRPVILITDDSKEDWWLEAHGRTIGPRPELLGEMRALAGVQCWMYDSTRFMEQARNHLKRSVSDETLAEVRDVQRQEEEARALTDEILDGFDGEPLASDVVDLLNVKQHWRLIQEELKKRRKFTVAACLVSTEPEWILEGELFIKFPTKTMSEMFRSRADAFSPPLREAIREVCSLDLRVRALGPGGLIELLG
jgi:hypothetical protein